MAPPCLVEKLTVQLPPLLIPPGLAASAGPAGAFEPQPLPAALHVGVVKTRLLHAEFCPHRASLGLRPAAQCFAKESRIPLPGSLGSGQDTRSSRVQPAGSGGEGSSFGGGVGSVSPDNATVSVKTAEVMSVVMMSSVPRNGLGCARHLSPSLSPVHELAFSIFR